MKAPIEWLLEGEAWVEYRTRLDLLGQNEHDVQVKSARKAMLENVLVQKMMAELTDWPGKVIASHKSAGQSFHKLTFIADLGIRAGDPGVDRIIERILDHQSIEGPFQLPMNIPVHYGGMGQDQYAWALCDAPLSVYALVKFGLQNEPPVKYAIEYLAELVHDNGWPCVVSKELGKFRGPGRKEDLCPFATLAMLKQLSEVEEWRDSPACRQGADTLLSLWVESTTRHPYMFFMGTDFRKLKVPFIWYDLIHMLEVLTRFSWIKQDQRLLDMLAILKNKPNQEGKYTLESIWTAWKDWEFGQKKESSRWLSLAIWRIFGRMGIFP